MSETLIERLRITAQQALLNGACGSEIALIFKEGELHLRAAEDEMLALGFFAFAASNDEVGKLYVSEGVIQFGIISLLFSIRYKNLPSIEWHR